MKNALVALNVVLVLAVAVLFYLHFSGKEKTTVASKSSTNASRQGDCSIAYFEMDSVTNSFSMVKDVKSELAKEEDQINRELSKLQKLYADRLGQYQQQAQTMSQIESERANRDMLQLQERIRGQQQEMDQKYQELRARKMQEIKSKIEEYLKEYNKAKGFSYILAYEPGMIFYRDTAYNITGDLLKGLNDQYKKK
jgi:outer membrane protein